MRCHKVQGKTEAFFDSKSMFVQGWEHPELSSFPGRLGPGNEDNPGWDAHGSILGLGMGWK